MRRRAPAVAVRLPKALYEFVVQRAAEGRLAGPGVYLAGLVRHDFERESERLRALAEEGLASGPGVEMTPARRTAMRKRLMSKRRRGSVYPAFTTARPTL